MKVADLFEKNNKELKILSHLKLPINKTIEKLILSQDLNKYTKYFSIIQVWRGKIIERTFAARNKKRPEYQEVIRRIEGNSNCLVRNMYFAWLSGYKTVWQDSKPNYWLFDKEKDMNEWFVASKQYYQTEKKALFTLEEVIQCDPTLKYCAWNGSPTITDYITIYRNYPEIEMLSKLGFSNVVGNITVLNKLKDKKFQKFLCKNANIPCNSSELLYAFRHNISIREVRVSKEINRNVKEVLEKFGNLNKEKLIKYFRKQHEKTGHFISATNYIDMLKAEEFFHLDLSVEKNIFPHDFEYWHDYYTSQMIISKNKLIDESMLAQSIKYKKMAKKINNLIIVFPTCTNDLIEEGEKLHNCVGRMGYNEKIANDTSLILFVREEEKTPLYTMEYDHHHHKILQFYADNNSLPPQEVDTVIKEKWLSRVKRLKFA